MDGSQPGAGNTRYTTQIEDEISSRILINLLSLIDHLHEIRGVNASPKTHNCNGFCCLLDGHSDFRVEQRERARDLLAQRETILRLFRQVFDERLDTITVRYDVDPFVGLHEAAHIWFNGALFEERWIGEAFASFYAEEAARRAGAVAVGFELTPEDDAELQRPLQSVGYYFIDRHRIIRWASVGKLYAEIPEPDTLLALT